MTLQAVERTWIPTGGYGRLRGEWVNRSILVRKGYFKAKDRERNTTKLGKYKITLLLTNTLLIFEHNHPTKKCFCYYLCRVSCFCWVNFQSCVQCGAVAVVCGVLVRPLHGIACILMRNTMKIIAFAEWADLIGKVVFFYSLTVLPTLSGQMSCNRSRFLFCRL